jgi:hypothetical protein
MGYQTLMKASPKPNYLKIACHSEASLIADGMLRFHQAKAHKNAKLLSKLYLQFQRLKELNCSTSLIILAAICSITSEISP